MSEHSTEPSPQTEAAVAEALAAAFGDRPVRRVLLIAPPDGDASMFDRAVARRKRYWNHPQYGLGIVASVLRADGVEVDILNVNHAVLEAARSSEETFDFDVVAQQCLASGLAAFEPDLIGITCMYSQAHTALLQTIAQIRALRPATPIALGGVHPTNAYVDLTTRQGFLADTAQADFLFLYEAEYSLRDFLRVASGRSGPEALSQTVFLRTDPLLSFADRARPEGEDLNVIPAFDLMRVSDMSRQGRVGAFYSLKSDDTVFATSLFGRGCRFHCTFCSVRQFNGVGVRSRSVETVLDELECMVTRHGVTHVTWLDDDFFYNKHRTMELFEGIVRRNLNLTWDCSNGVVAACCTEELIAAAEDAGCIGLYLGVESGNPDVLKSIEKPGTVDYFRRAAAILKRHPRIHARAFIIIGLPGETVAQIKDTFDLCREMDLDWCHINIYNALPNTPAFSVSDDAVDASLTEFRFNSGAYGRKNEAEARLPNSFAATCEGVFDGPDLNYVPDRQELDLIWVHMNYYVNFARLTQPMSEEKLRQNELYVLNIVNTVDPGNAIAYWYAAELGRRLRGRADEAVVTRLQSLLDDHEAWARRFKELALSPDSLNRTAAE